MSDTATIPLWDAIGALIDLGESPPVNANGDPILEQADPQIPGRRWPRFHRGVARNNSKGSAPPPGYFLLGMVNLTPAGGYNGETGEDGTVTVHCWAATPDDAERLYRWLHGLLHDQPIAVSGFGHPFGNLSKSGPTPDASGTAWQVIAVYTVDPEDA